MQISLVLQGICSAYAFHTFLVIVVYSHDEIY